jgi:uncharacterized protein (TIGR02996 family)
MTSTQRALLKAVAANPHDDTPRLVYADWLDEQAADLPRRQRESTAARAEIIRVQCELARLADEDCDSRWVYEYLDTEGLYDLQNAEYRVNWSVVDAGVARRVELRARDAQLTAQYSEEWRKREAPDIEGVSFSLRRGFWTYLSLGRAAHDVGRTAKAVVKHPNYVPTEALHCDFVLTADGAKQLIASGLTDHLAAVSDVNWERPTLFTELGRTKTAASIRAVAPGSNPQDFMAPFARSANWKGIRSIEVVAHGDHQPRMKALAKCRHLSRLQSLRLYPDARAASGDVSAVAVGVWKNLRRLDWDAWLDDEDAATLADGKAMSELRYLRLGNQIGGEGASEVLTSDRLENIAVIDLHSNTISGLNAAAIREVERPSLRVLNLGSANNDPFSRKKGFAKADLLAVAKSPISHHLHILNLSGNDLTDPAVEAFFHSMRIPHLTMLDLSGNRELGPVTAEAIASCDRLTNLQALDLMWTKIGNAGAKALAKSKHLTKLRYLNVSQTKVTATGLAALRKRFGDDAVRG